MGNSALIVIDMINAYDHPDAELLAPSVRRALPHLARLIDRARAEGVPVIYANDNFGQWRSHHGEIIETTLAGKNAELVEPCCRTTIPFSSSRPGTPFSTKRRSAICSPNWRPTMWSSAVR